VGQTWGEGGGTKRTLAPERKAPGTFVRKILDVLERKWGASKITARKKIPKKNRIKLDQGKNPISLREKRSVPPGLSPLPEIKKKRNHKKTA